MKKSQKSGDIKQRESRAIRELYRRFNRPIFNFFANRGFDLEECHDMVQETFLYWFSGNATPGVDPLQTSIPPSGDGSIAGRKNR